jgi:hypothetical protein
LRRHYFVANGLGGKEQTIKAGLILVLELPQRKLEGDSKKRHLVVDGVVAVVVDGVVAVVVDGYNVVVVGEDGSKEDNLLRSKASEST